MKINFHQAWAPWSTLIQLSFLASSFAGTDPQLSSWFTVRSSQPAQIYASDADKLAGKTETTWNNGRLSQSQPAYSGVQQILYSDNWVYIRSSGLGSHVMGPWYIDPQHWRAFPNLPTDQHLLLRFPRNPKAQTNPGFQPLGEIGMFVDGVMMFDSNDAFSYATAMGRDASPRAGIGRGDQVWNRDAFANESITFDAALGHQQNWGRYHYHSQPIALRYLLGDHVDYDATTKTYAESKAPVMTHSPILGWMRDGYPLYGPYGFANPTNPASGVRRMLSGYTLRNGSNGSDNLALTGRRVLPEWVGRQVHRQTHLGPNAFGPNVTAMYPLGHYIEDCAFLGDLGRTQSKDFDLDELNGRWCVTPDLPQGTYAYFTTIDAKGTPVYPYNMGRAYHGVPSGRLVNSINEPVTTTFNARNGVLSNAQRSPGTRAVSLVWHTNSGSYGSQ
jgi:YHYH protein